MTRSGVSIVELLVAVVIVSVGVAGGGAMPRWGVSMVELLVAVVIVGVGGGGVAPRTAAAARSLVHARA
ncbi:MAG: prepilin-type N-terminal cleavage/methylation domain-containing protein, partial [Gemmatimonadetes bacterium]|nr:prepilin-type N-terminal cleavage/methylation domain-containing protein [Gemmatimonadota bacterium]